MTTYRVQWTEYIEADDQYEAAKMAVPLLMKDVQIVTAGIALPHTIFAIDEQPWNEQGRGARAE